MKILLIDNYDSFTYNLLHLIKSTGALSNSIDIILNDRVTPEIASRYTHIVISPGPGIPSEAGNTLRIIRQQYPHIPILGICLGHQAIAEALGARLVNNGHPLHGIKSSIRIDTASPLFHGLPSSIGAGRYHSWLVDRQRLPSCLHVTAVDEQDNIMAISHNQYPVHGLQFHPESIMTDCGTQIMSNFLNLQKHEH